MKDAEAVNREQTAENALLETGPNHDRVVALVHRRALSVTLLPPSVLLRVARSADLALFFLLSSPPLQGTEAKRYMTTPATPATTTASKCTCPGYEEHAFKVCICFPLLCCFVLTAHTHRKTYVGCASTLGMPTRAPDTVMALPFPLEPRHYRRQRLRLR